MSPAEQIVEEAAPQDMLAGLDEEVEGDPIRPWTPKGLAQPDAQVTVEGVDLVSSPPPVQTAGGAPPASRKSLGQFGPEGS